MEVSELVNIILETILETVTEYILSCFKCIEDDGTISKSDEDATET